MASWFPGLSGSRYATRERVKQFLEVTANQAVTEALEQALQQLDADTIAALETKASQDDLEALEVRVTAAEADILLRALQTALDTLEGRVTTAEGDIDLLEAGSASQGDLVAHTGDTDNPHAVTATQVGLGAVDNTADIDKPVSTATQDALDLKANETDLVALEGELDSGVTAVETLTAPGAVSVDHGLTLIEVAGAAEAYTLADGAAGQVKAVVLAVAGAGESAVLTPATALGWTDATLDAAGDSLTLAWTSYGWVITGNQGVTVT